MDLFVTAAPDGAWLDWGAGKKRAAIGPGGIAVKTGEGDNITPRGRFPVREIFYRPDRVPAPRTALPSRAIAPDDGWCDAPGDSQYNRLVKLPYPASAEHMWRDDHLYDLLAVLGYNDDPVVPGKGSAIFLHMAKRVGEVGSGSVPTSDNQKSSGYLPTQGCVALAYGDLLAALEQLRPGDEVVIE